MIQPQVAVQPQPRLAHISLRIGSGRRTYAVEQGQHEHAGGQECDSNRLNDAGHRVQSMNQRVEPRSKTESPGNRGHRERDERGTHRITR